MHDNSAAPNGGIYVILDTLSDQVIGGLQLHKHDAVAIRTFGDIAGRQDSVVHLHPADYQLVRLGYLTASNDLEPDRAVIMTGAQWAAIQEAR